MTVEVEVHRRGASAELALRGELDGEDLRVPRLRAQSLLATGHDALLVDVRDAVVGDPGLDLLAYVQRVYRRAGGTCTVTGLPLELELELLRREQVDRRLTTGQAPAWAPSAPVRLPGCGG